MSIFVFYRDGYADSDGIGFEELPSIYKAQEFIDARMAACSRAGDVPSIDNYTVVDGQKLKITSVEVVSKINLSR